MDELGRPVVWRVGGDGTRGAGRDGEEVEERRRRVESFLKDSNMSLVRVSGPGGGL